MSPDFTWNHTIGINLIDLVDLLGSSVGSGEHLRPALPNCLPISALGVADRDEERLEEYLALLWLEVVPFCKAHY